MKGINVPPNAGVSSMPRPPHLSRGLESRDVLVSPRRIILRPLPAEHNDVGTMRIVRAARRP
jgi:hypothetical protein